MRSSTSRCRVISITFPSHPHHIPITFPAHFNRIPITYISITFPAHSQHISITFPSHSHHTSTSLPPHASRPAAPNLSNLAFSGTVNQEHQTQHQTQPTPVAACCGDGLDRSCSAPTAVAACTIAVRCCSCVWAVSPKTLLCGGNTKRFRIGSKMNETVQN